MNRKIFLIDGLGALVSTILLIVLSFYADVLGMPALVMRRLVPIPTLFIFYSFIVYFTKPANWKIFLMTIAASNLCYCLLTLGLVIWYIQSLTLLGILYFMGEIIIIIILSFFEFKIAKD